MSSDGKVERMATCNSTRSPRSRPTHQRPSMADVASMAGVSSQTFSRVANNRENVDSATREKVLAAMQASDTAPTRRPARWSPAGSGRWAWSVSTWARTATPVRSARSPTPPARPTSP
ncbi:LacI family DNA-binding transcriptional regulator [Streptomyces sp. NPDC051742]|uniref:LacI family DNA-binding transcriptional regulator n=1 Tax=Streptomyces sp. NPDC051742 TaxID=3155169 RepID=UPI0034325F1E